VKEAFPDLFLSHFGEGITARNDRYRNDREDEVSRG